MEEFKEFVSKHEKIKNEVRTGKRTWQNIYEEWVLYGENDPQWQAFANSDEAISRQGKNLSINVESLKNVVEYIKKINPDDLNKTLNTVQKVIQIAQTVSSKPNAIPIIPNVYNDWWD